MKRLSLSQMKRRRSSNRTNARTRRSISLETLERRDLLTAIDSSIMADEPIAYLPFDESSEDVSGFESHATQHGGAFTEGGQTDRPGDYSITLGDGDYVEIEDGLTTVNYSDQSTVTFWQSSPTLSETGLAVEVTSNTEGSPSVVSISIGDSAIQLETGSDNVGHQASLEGLNDQWNHWAFVVDGVNNVSEIYVNGVSFTSGSLGSELGQWGTFSIGHQYTGQLDDLAIYDQALTADQIRSQSQASNVTAVDVDRVSLDVNENASVTFDGSDVLGTNRVAESVGNFTMDRGSDNDGLGGIYVVNDAFTENGVITEWSIFDADDAGESVTPVIVRQVAYDGENPAAGETRWEVVAIGESRTSDGSGQQSFDFGNEQVGVQPGDFLGWVDDNAGVVDWTADTPSSSVVFLGDDPNAITGDDAIQQVEELDRTYSVQATTAVIVGEIEGQAVVIDQPVTLDSGATVTLAGNGELTFDPNGAFDDLRIGDEGTDSFVISLPNQHTDLTENLIGHWTMNDAVPTDFVSDHDGTINGDVVTGPGVLGDSFVFDGDNDFVTFGDIDELDRPGFFTISTWFRRDVDHTGPENATINGVNNVLFAHASANETDTIEIGTEGDNVEIWLDSGNGSQQDFLSVPTPEGITDGEWYHVALTYDKLRSYEAEVYFDGVPIGMFNQFSSRLDPTDETPVSIGGSAVDSEDPTGDFEGAIDDVSIWTEALEPSEILAIICSAQDGTSFHEASEVTLTVTGVSLPEAEDDYLTVSEDYFVTTSLVENDYDPEGDTLIVTEVNESSVDIGETVTLDSGATLLVTDTGYLAYNPNGAYDHLSPGETLEETISYQVSDMQTGSDTGIVTITIEGRNDTPTATDDVVYVVFDVDRVNTGDVIVTETGVDADPDGNLTDGLTLQYEANGENDLSWQNTGSETNRDIYLPEAGITLVSDDATPTFSTSFGFDGTQGVDLGSMSIGDKTSTTIELWIRPQDLTQSSVILETGNSHEGASIVLDGDQLRFNVISEDSHSLPDSGYDPHNVHVEVTADLDLNDDGLADNDGFTQVVGVIDMDTDQVRLYIDGSLVDVASSGQINDWTNSTQANLGQVDGDIGGGTADSALELGNLSHINENYRGEIASFRLYGESALTNNDVIRNYHAEVLASSDSLVVSAINGNSANVGMEVTLDSGAIVTLSADGTYVYNENGQSGLAAGQTAQDTFNYTVSDGYGGSSVGTVTVVVTPDVAEADQFAGTDDVALSVAAPGLLANDAVNNETVGGLNGTDSLTGVSDLGATVTLNADGSFSFDPSSSATIQSLPEGETVVDGFSYTVVRDGVTYGEANVEVTVEGSGGIEIDLTDNFANVYGASSLGNDGEMDRVEIATNLEGNVDIIVNGQPFRTLSIDALFTTNVELSGGNDDTLFVISTDNLPANGITIHGGGGSNTIEINDASDTLSGDVTIYGDTVQGVLSTGALNFDDISDLTITLGSGDTVIDIAENPYNHVTVNAGGGTDSLAFDIPLTEAVNVFQTSVNGNSNQVGWNNIQSFEINDQPMDLGGLYVGLTNSGEQVTIGTQTNGRTYVDVNEENAGRYALTGQIVVDAGDGDDVIELADTPTQELTISGGEGDDSLSLQVPLGDTPNVVSTTADSSWNNLGWNSIQAFEINNEPMDSNGLYVTLTGGVDRAVFSTAGQGGTYASINGENVGSYVLSGEVVVVSGEGNDEITMNTSDCAGATVHSGGGQDFITMGSCAATIDAGAGNDKIVTGDANDVIVAGLGNDEVISNGGNDVVYGGDGNDRILGGAGDDVLYGDFGNDYLNGGDGNDLLVGRFGNDISEGGAGDDVLLGGSGRDTLRGNAGDDLIVGGDDADILFGDEGSNRLVSDIADVDIYNDAVLNQLLNDWTQLRDITQLGESNTNDEAADELFGDADLDTILANANDTITGPTL
jgi:Ca2+-binding RTX toxin-like protein